MSRAVAVQTSGFMTQRGKGCEQDRYQTLSNKPPERKAGSFDPAWMYYLLRSGSAYSLPIEEPMLSSGLASRVPISGRAGDTTTTMHATHRSTKTETQTTPSQPPTDPETVHCICAMNPSRGLHLHTPPGVSRTTRQRKGVSASPGVRGFGGGARKTRSPPSTPPSRANGDAYSEGGGRDE